MEVSKAVRAAVSRRQFIHGSGITLASLALAHARAAVFPGAGWGTSGVSSAGFYPLSHSYKALDMRIVYPRPDGETNSYAAHHYAYWNGTTGIQYRRRVGVSFGRFPYVYELMSGPPGMTIGATIWNAAWNCSPRAAAQAGYGVVSWTPTAANVGSGGPWTVTVRVYDQNYQSDGTSYVDVTWTLNLAGDYNGTSKTGFLFVDSTNGNDANAGGLATPLKTLQGAYGASYGTTQNPQALCVLRGSATSYVPPAYTDNTYTAGKNWFQWNPTTKPCGILVYPGESITIDWTGTQTTPYQSAYTSVGAGDDAFFQDILLNGYLNDGATGNIRGFDLASNRVTFDNVQWTNSGYGFSAASNATLFFLNSSDAAPKSYVFITGCLDSGRQSGTPGNNYGFNSCYGHNDVLVEFNELYAPSSSMDGAIYFKDGTEYGCQRGNFTSVTSTAHIHSVGQSFNDHPTNDCEFCFNTVLSVGGANQWLPQTGGFTWGSVWTYRNNFANSTLKSSQTSYNLMGPTINSATPSTGSGSLAAGTYYYQGTTLGVTGESTHADGNGNNEHSATLSATGEITLSLTPAPDGSNIRIYRGATSGGENQYVTIAANSTTFVDDGTLSWTSATPPGSSTAVSADRFTVDSNAFQSSTAIPTGAIITDDGNNAVVASGMLDTTTGLLTSAYKTSNPSAYGMLGAEIA